MVSGVNNSQTGVDVSIPYMMGDAIVHLSYCGNRKKCGKMYVMAHIPFGLTNTLKVRCPACRETFIMDVRIYDQLKGIGCPNCKVVCHKDHYEWWVTLYGRGDFDIESLKTLLIGEKHV